MEHKHDFTDRIFEIKKYTNNASVGIFRCNCGFLFARPISEEEENLFLYLPCPRCEVKLVARSRRYPDRRRKGHAYWCQKLINSNNYENIER